MSEGKPNISSQQFLEINNRRLCREMVTLAAHISDCYFEVSITPFADVVESNFGTFVFY